MNRSSITDRLWPTSVRSTEWSQMFKKQKKQISSNHEKSQYISPPQKKALMLLFTLFSGEIFLIVIKQESS